MSDNSSTSSPSPTSKPEKTRKTLHLLITVVAILAFCISISLYYSHRNLNTSERLEVKVRTEGFGYPYRLSFTDESTKNVYEAKMMVGSSSSVNGTFVFDNIPAGQYVPYIYYHELGLPLTSGNGGVTSGAAVITVNNGDHSIMISVGPGWPNHVIGP